MPRVEDFEQTDPTLTAITSEKIASSQAPAEAKKKRRRPSTAFLVIVTLLLGPFVLIFFIALFFNFAISVASHDSTVKFNETLRQLSTPNGCKKVFDFSNNGGLDTTSSTANIYHNCTPFKAPVKNSEFAAQAALKGLEANSSADQFSTTISGAKICGYPEYSYGRGTLVHNSPEGAQGDFLEPTKKDNADSTFNLMRLYFSCQ